MSGGDAGPMPLSIRHGHDAAEVSRAMRNVLDLVEKCQACAMDGSSGLMVDTLRSIYRALIALRSPSSPQGAGDGELSPNGTRHHAEVPREESGISNSSATIEPHGQEFLRTVAESLISMDRAIGSIDEEINGDYSDSLDYEDDYGWYRETMENLRVVGSANARETDSPKHPDDVNPEGNNLSERWIDRCLDMCGYANSLEAAADILRRIVHDSSSSPSATMQPNKYALKGGRRSYGLAAIVASLRTIRRRLVLLPPSTMNACACDSLRAIQEPYQSTLMHLAKALGPKTMRHLCECIILPLEYHSRNRQSHQQQPITHSYAQLNTHNLHKDQLLSESLSSLATSVISTLVSSACHTTNLPLPPWAAPKASCGVLIHVAWKILLAGELLGKSIASVSKQNSPSSAIDTGDSNVTSSTLITASSDHFRLVIRKMIDAGRSDIVVHHFYNIWETCDADGSCELSGQLPSAPLDPRVVLCRQLQTILSSIQSKREAAVFTRSFLRYCAKQHLRKCDVNTFSGQRARDQLDILFGSNNRFVEILLPCMSKDPELVEAMVNFIILTPPASFHSPSESSWPSFSTLHAADWAVPRSLSQLLALSSTADADADQEDSNREDSEDESQDSTGVNALLGQLYTVASVWCEDIFVTRTDPLQQQYVTEFLLHPLESKQLTPTDLQASISDDGTQLATTLVQGVTFRLDVSRPESIRVDGMRVAEAMATLLGQTLRFEELHPPQYDDNDGIQIEGDIAKRKPVKKDKKRKNNRVRAVRKAAVVVDPDAEYFTDYSDSSRDSSQSGSSTDSRNSDESSDDNSSWGEDSLEPYDMNDDEEDLRRVHRPRTLRECLAYLILPDDDDSAYDKHQAALTELPTIVATKPLDLLDVVSSLVRILLFLEDKFNIDQFATNRWDSLMAFGVHAPIETCIVLVKEMKGNIGLGTRMDALAVLSGVAQELSGNLARRQKAISSPSDDEVADCSTKLQRVLDLQDSSNSGGTKVDSDLFSQPSKTRRWRKVRTPPAVVTNKFCAVSVQMIYSLFALLSETRNDETLWGGPIGEKFLAEFLRTLSIMLHCARTYPSPALQVLAADLFDLAWSFHDAKSPEVRYAALVAVATCVSIFPALALRIHMAPFLRRIQEEDASAECRNLASLVQGTLTEELSQNLIEMKR